jgi:hypothetical protein
LIPAPNCSCLFLVCFFFPAVFGVTAARRIFVTLSALIVPVSFLPFCFVFPPSCDTLHKSLPSRQVPVNRTESRPREFRLEIRAPNSGALDIVGPRAVHKVWSVIAPRLMEPRHFLPRARHRPQYCGLGGVISPLWTISIPLINITVEESPVCHFISQFDVTLSHARARADSNIE